MYTINGINYYEEQDQEAIVELMKLYNNQMYNYKLIKDFININSFFNYNFNENNFSREIGNILLKYRNNVVSKIKFIYDVIQNQDYNQGYKKKLVYKNYPFRIENNDIKKFVIKLVMANRIFFNHEHFCIDKILSEYCDNMSEEQIHAILEYFNEINIVIPNIDNYLKELCYFNDKKNNILLESPDMEHDINDIELIKIKKLQKK